VLTRAIADLAEIAGDTGFGNLLRTLGDLQSRDTNGAVVADLRFRRVERAGDLHALERVDLFEERG